MIGQLAIKGDASWFRINMERMEKCVSLVTEECELNYPDLNIPYHSRWRHFNIQGQNLWDYYCNRELAGIDAAEKSRIAIDLVFLSVLLDAGAGPDWVYVDPVTGISLNRSEGLAAASIHLFFRQMANRDDYSLTSAALGKISQHTFSTSFQCSATNPLVGVKGRCQLLKNLASQLNTLESAGIKRPGDLYDRFLSQAHKGSIQAGSILLEVLGRFNSMWPSGMLVKNHNLGDCGYHHQAGAEGDTNGIVPFHKLSQWLSYSLVEPLQWAGLGVTDIDQLTGLPEYRNGGLLLDTGLLEPLDKNLLLQSHKVAAEPVVEWRALTVFLLDMIADEVRKKLGKNSLELPLASVLQGGTWSAGRRLANALRPGGAPPVQLEIDGTIF